MPCLLRRYEIFSETPKAQLGSAGILQPGGSCWREDWGALWGAGLGKYCPRQVQEASRRYFKQLGAVHTKALGLPCLQLCVFAATQSKKLHACYLSQADLFLLRKNEPAVSESKARSRRHHSVPVMNRTNDFTEQLSLQRLNCILCRGTRRGSTFAYSLGIPPQLANPPAKKSAQPRGHGGVWVQFRRSPPEEGFQGQTQPTSSYGGWESSVVYPSSHWASLLKTRLKKTPHAVCIIYILGHQIFSFQPWIIPFIVFQCLVLGNILLFSMQFRNMPKICLQK